MVQVQLTVREFMTENPITVREDASVKDVSDLMTRKGIRHLPVVGRQDQLVGLITQRDYLTIAISKLADVPRDEANEIYSMIKVRDVMGEAVVTVESDVPIGDAAKIMFERKFGCLPVMQKGKLIGILTEADFVRAMIAPSASGFALKGLRMPKVLRQLGAASKASLLRRKASRG